MPVSVVCDAASVNAAIRESIANSSSTTCSGLTDEAQSLQSNLVASTKRVLLSALEYEEVNKFSPLNVFDTTVKSKCIPLKPLGNGKLNQACNGDKDSHQNSSSALNAIPGQGHRDVNQLPQPKRILFPRENVQIGWKSSSRKWQVGTGMMNVGNTCYLNSTLQALFHVPAMANWLIADAAHREKCEDESGSQGGCIICAMSKTLIASQSSQSPIRPYLIYSKLKLVCKHLVMGRQEDAHEFLRYLVEAMEKSYLARFRNSKELEQYSKETTPLNQILGGYLKSAVRCLTCGHVSTTYQHFQDLLLDIRKANSIEEALDGYFSRERLEDMGYKCEACKKKVSATKQFFLERAPISLCIQLKRFSMVGTKINKHVTIRPHLDLTPYAASKKNSEQLKYRLVAMVTHLGASQHCGHYTAIGYTDAGGYYQYDDSCVRPISMQNVLNTNAYIIFYELEDSQDCFRQTSTQVSGNHSDQAKANGQIQYNENIQQRQASNISLSSSNGNASVSINSKIISKLEVSSTSTMIGPQLPERPLLKCTQNSNENGYKSIDAQKVTQNGLVTNNSFSKLVNLNSSKPNKAHNENSNNQIATFTSNSLISPKYKENQPVGSKLLIHFKNNTNNCNSDLFGTSSKFHESNGSRHQAPNSAKVESNIGDCSSPLVNQNKSTLPSMPKLESPAGGKDKTPLLHNGLFTSILNSDSKKPLLNGLSKPEKPSAIKSLVPYESDDESNDSACVNSSKSDSKSENNPSRVIYQTNTLKRNFKSSEESLSSSSESEKGSPKFKKRTPPSPPVVKTKTGLWQVTSLDVKPNLNTGNAGPIERKNPFATVTTAAIAPSNFYSNNSQKANGKDKKLNSNKWNEANNNGESKETVNHLLKFSHRGYGAPVLSWNGHKTDMEKEIVEENRLERKRELRDDEENEMDRGRQKKIKQHVPPGRDNPGYNPFQEYQNQQQHQHRRWNGNGHSNGRSFHQNYTYRQNSSHRNQNNFRRHRFYQRPHHQRNGDHGFHHRRDS